MAKGDSSCPAPPCCADGSPQAAPASRAARAAHGSSMAKPTPTPPPPPIRRPHHLKAPAPGELRRALCVRPGGRQDVAQVTQLAVLCSTSTSQGRRGGARAVAGDKPAGQSCCPPQHRRPPPTRHPRAARGGALNTIAGGLTQTPMSGMRFGWARFRTSPASACMSASRIGAGRCRRPPSSPPLSTLTATGVSKYVARCTCRRDQG